LALVDRREVEIDGRYIKRGVAHIGGDEAEADTGVEQVGGIAMAQGVADDGLGQAGGAAGGAQADLGRAGLHVCGGLAEGGGGVPVVAPTRAYTGDGARQRGDGHAAVCVKAWPRSEAEG